MLREKQIGGENMQINKLKVKNFRCYEDMEIDFDPRLTVIVGENGKGKTAIFDAIAMGLEPYLQSLGVEGRRIGVKDVRRVPEYKEDGVHIERMVNQYPLEITLTGETSGKTVSCTKTMHEDGSVTVRASGMIEGAASLRDKLAKHEDIVLPAFAYYGTARIWADSSLMADYDTSLEKREIGYKECMEPSSSYNNFGTWFEHVSRCAQQEHKVAEELQRHQMVKNAIQRAIDTCLQSTGFHDLYYNFQLGAFVINHPDMGEMLVDDLSDGFRSVLSMVADLAYRMVRLNPQLGENAVVETPGLVLVDEIDMHLHPAWQQTVLLDVQRAFPLVQFIVTTHSPQVLSSVPAESIRVLMWGRHFEGVRRVSFAMGATSTQILQDIQNVGLRAESLPIVQDLKRYLNLVSQDKWDTPEALALRKRLDAWAKGNEPALLRADMDIRMRQFRRKRS
ncbi:AAA family ATPase [Phascolarctobacterium sp.]|uniref:AAA family ATPase n=2 Tax=Phascolarctobacterium sp. TaxID=2049039 RepID=UPI0038702DE4